MGYECSDHPATKSVAALRELMDERDKRYELEFLTLKNQSPTTADHVALYAKVDTLMSSKDILAGKSSQSSNNILLAIAVIGTLVSMCIGGLTLITLLAHLFGVF